MRALTAAALAGIGRYFIGGFDTGGSAWSKNRQPSKYVPHQGKRECDRRVRQIYAGQTASNGLAV